MADTNKHLNIFVRLRDQTASGFGAIGLRLRNLTKIASFVGVTVGPAALALSLKRLTQEGFNTVDMMGDLADRSGLSVTALGGLQHAAFMTDVDVGKLNSGVEKYLVNISKAADATTDAGKALRAIGLDARDLEQLSTDKQLLLIADALTGVAGAADRARLAGDIFGKGQTELISLLGKGSAAIRGLQREAELLGVAVSEVDAQKVAEADEALKRLRAGVAGIGNTIAIQISPAIEKFANELVEILPKVRADIEAILSPESVNNFATQSSDAAESWTGIAGSVRSVLAAANAIFQTVQAAIATIVQAMTGVAAPLAGIAVTARIFVEGFFEQISAGWRRVRLELPEWLGGIKSQSVKDIFGLPDQQEAFNRAIANGFPPTLARDLVTGMAEATAAIEKGIIEDLSQPTHLLADKLAEVEEVWSKVGGFIGDGFDDWKTSASEATTAIDNMLKAFDAAEALNKASRERGEKDAAELRKVIAENKVLLAEAGDLQENIGSGAPGKKPTVNPEPFKLWEKAALRASDVVANSFSRTFDTVIDGTFRLKDAAADLVRDVASAIQRSLTQLAVSGLFGSQQGGVYQPGAFSGLFQSIFSAFGATAADGAIWKGGFTPIQKFAMGSPRVDRPTLGLIGEGGMSEAVIPLPDGRSVPVTMRGGGGTVINYHNFNVSVSAIDQRGISDWLQTRESQAIFRSSFLEAAATRSSVRRVIG